MRTIQKTARSLVAATAMTSVASALVDPGLTGTAETEIWSGLTGTNYPDYPDFSDTGDGGFSSLWPSPISPTGVGSAGKADFDKVGGGGYPASNSLYNHTIPGTYRVANGNPLSGLETVVFQIDLGAGSPGFFASTPVLNYDSGTQNLAPDFSEVGTGDFSSAFGGPPVPTTLHAFQWDLSSIPGPVSDYQIVWTTDTFATTFELGLYSSDTYTGNSITAVPEASMTGAVLGILGFACLRRRSRRQAWK